MNFVDICTAGRRARVDQDHAQDHVVVIAEGGLDLVKGDPDLGIVAREETKRAEMVDLVAINNWCLKRLICDFFSQVFFAFSILTIVKHKISKFYL